PFHTANERLRRLDEACDVIRALFSGRRSSYSGRYYQLTDAAFEPKPVQPRIPLLLAATGEKIALGIVAKHADLWNMPGRPEVVEPKLRALERHCLDIGRDPREIEPTVLTFVRFVDDRSGEAMPYPAEWTISGRPAELRESLRRYVDIGIEHVLVISGRSAASTLASRKNTADRFFTEVASAFR